MFEMGDKINHSVFGEGEVVFIDSSADYFGKEHIYIDIHFNNDEKYQVRTFTEESIKPFLVR